MFSASVTLPEDLIVISLQSYQRNRRKSKLNNCNLKCNNEVLLLATVVMWLHIFHFTLIHCIASPPFSFRNLS